MLNKKLRVWKYNVFIGLKTKSLFLILLVVTIFLVSVFSFAFLTDFEKSSISREEELDLMKQELLANELLINNNVIHPLGKEQLLKTEKLYMFLFENNFVKSDFYDIYGFFKINYNFDVNHKNATIMFFCLKLMGIMLNVSAIILALLVFGNYYKKGIKNIIYSGISKKSLYYENYLFGSTFLFILWLLFLLTGIIFGCKENDYILFENGEYFIKEVKQVYLYAAFSKYLLAQLLFSIFVFLTNVSKKDIEALLWFLCVILFFLILAMWEASMVFDTTANYEYSAIETIIPIVSINSNYGGVSLHSLINIFYHAMIVVIMLIGGQKKFVENEY